jgi:hypothetical protein
MFLNNYRWNYPFYFIGISLGKSVDNKKYYYREIYQRNEAGNFFNASVPLVNPSVIIFFITNGFTDGQKIIDERFTNEAFPMKNPIK